MLSCLWYGAYIKEPLLLLGKSSPCVDNGFPLSLSEWFFTICPTPYNRNKNVLSVLLNKTLFKNVLSLSPECLWFVFFLGFFCGVFMDFI